MTATGDPVPNFANALRAAAATARRQEERTQGELVGDIMLRAATNAALRDELTKDPAKVLQRETAGQLTPEVAEKAARMLSVAIPGTDAEKVEKLVFDTVEDMRRSFKMTLELSRWLFFAGLAMLALAFGAAFGSNHLAVGLSGSGGIISLLLSALRNPLDRVRNAAANLAQIQASYLGFYKQLYILGARVEGLSHDDTIAYARAINEAANGMVVSVNSAFENGVRAQAAQARTRTARIDAAAPAPTGNAPSNDGGGGSQITPKRPPRPRTNVAAIKPRQAAR
jgi:hypothetical protein